MRPDDNSESSINVWCDWLTDNGYNSDEIRFEDVEDNSSGWERYPFFGPGTGVGFCHGGSSYGQGFCLTLGYIGGCNVYMGRNVGDL